MSKYKPNKDDIDNLRMIFKWDPLDILLEPDRSKKPYRFKPSDNKTAGIGMNGFNEVYKTKINKLKVRVPADYNIRRDYDPSELALKLLQSTKWV